MNSRKVEVLTHHRKSGARFRAVSSGHLERIHEVEGGEAQPPTYDVTKSEHTGDGTEIRIYGYNHDDGAKLGHDQLRDYILWFTKFGSIEPLLWSAFPSKSWPAKGRLETFKLELRGLGFDPAKHADDAGAPVETLAFGHPFPDGICDGKALREKAKSKKVSPTDLYCRRFVREGVLSKFPGHKWQAVFSIEGNPGIAPRRRFEVTATTTVVWMALRLKRSC